MDAQGSGHAANAIVAILDQLDQRANRLRVPTAYASAVYTPRSYIDLVRERLSISADRQPHDFEISVYLLNLAGAPGGRRAAASTGGRAS